MKKARCRRRGRDGRMDGGTEGQRDRGGRDGGMDVGARGAACIAEKALSLDTSSPSSGSPILNKRCAPLGVAVLAPAGFGLPSRTRPGPSMSPRNFFSGLVETRPPKSCVFLWPQHASRSGVPGERARSESGALPHQPILLLELLPLNVSGRVERIARLSPLELRRISVQPLNHRPREGPRVPPPGRASGYQSQGRHLQGKLQSRQHQQL